MVDKGNRLMLLSGVTYSLDKILKLSGHNNVQAFKTNDVVNTAPAGEMPNKEHFDDLQLIVYEVKQGAIINNRPAVTFAHYESQEDDPIIFIKRMGSNLILSGHKRIAQTRAADPTAPIFGRLLSTVAMKAARIDPETLPFVFVPEYDPDEAAKAKATPQHQRKEQIVLEERKPVQQPFANHPRISVKRRGSYPPRLAK